MSQSASPLPEYSVPTSGSVVANKGKLFISLLVLVGALGYFAFVAFESATVYYYTVGEMNDVGATPEGKMVRVSGKLIPDTFNRSDRSTVAKFALTDGTESLVATHTGVLPDLFFNDHSEIILEGTFGPDGVFASENVIVKCPSKYIAVEEEQGERSCPIGAPTPESADHGAQKRAFFLIRIFGAWSQASSRQGDAFRTTFPGGAEAHGSRDLGRIRPSQRLCTCVSRRAGVSLRSPGSPYQGSLQ